MAEHLGEVDRDGSPVVNALITETLMFRNKLKEDTGEVLTVGDTRVALDALTRHLEDGTFTGDLTPEQKALAQIWVDRLTIFKTR